MKRKYKAAEGVNESHLVQTQIAKVGHVRMQMALEGVGVIYKAGSSR